MNIPQIKILKAGTALVISCIAVYGIIYAQPVCCNILKSVHTPIFSGISAGYDLDGICWKVSSRDLNSQLQSVYRNGDLAADFASGHSCCESLPCHGSKQNRYLSRLSVRDFFPFLNATCTVDMDNVDNFTITPVSLPAPSRPSTIFILTQSFLC